MYDATGMTGDEQDQARSATGDSSGFNPFGGSSFTGGNPFGGQQYGGGFGSFKDIMNEFEEIFGGERVERKAYRGEDIHMSLTIPFMDAAKGNQAVVEVDRKATCGTCHGTKVKPGSAPSKCTNCGGRGVVFFQRGPMSIQTPCQKCKGTGSTIRHFCPACKGLGISQSHVREVISIPAGVDSGKSLRVAGKGHHSESGGPPGDLIVRISVQPHKTFKRDGYDLYTTVLLPLSRAALGGTVVVETLEGHMNLKVEHGEELDVPKRIPNKGIQHLPPDDSKRGNLYVTLQVQIPTKLTEKQRVLFTELAKEDSNEVTAESDDCFSRFFGKKQK